MNATGPQKEPTGNVNGPRTIHLQVRGRIPPLSILHHLSLGRVNQFGFTTESKRIHLEAELKKALASIDVNKVKDSKRRAYEGLVLNSLYENHEDAIKYAAQYQTEEPGNPSPLILAYLGFAFGQQYKEAKGAGKPDADLEVIKKKSLDSITKALQLEPNLKPLIRMVWDPNDVAKFPGSEDDDLEVFKDDPGFKALLG